MSIESHYRINTYYKSLDTVVGELRYRFQTKDNDVLCSLGDVCLNIEPSINSFATISQFYHLDSDLVQSERRVFSTFLKNHEEIIVNTASDLVRVIYENELFDLLPYFCEITDIVAPASSCSAERSFSTLRRLKTHLRSTMGQHRLTNLVLLHIERLYTNQVLADSMDRIIDSFGQRHQRDSYLF